MSNMSSPVREWRGCLFRKIQFSNASIIAFPYLVQIISSYKCLSTFRFYVVLGWVFFTHPCLFFLGFYLGFQVLVVAACMGGSSSLSLGHTINTSYYRTWYQWILRTSLSLYLSTWSHPYGLWAFGRSRIINVCDMELLYDCVDAYWSYRLWTYISYCFACLGCP
jgi:hypothetical protein